MSSTSNKYITDIQHTLNLNTVKTLPFMKALEEVYGEESTKTAMRYIFSDHTKTKYEAGIKAFQERFTVAMSNDGSLSGDDQKYLADVTQRVALGQLKLNKTQVTTAQAELKSVKK